MPGTTYGTRDVTDIGEDAPVSKARVPHSVFNPVGCSVAIYCTLWDDLKHLFLGKVMEIVIAPVRNEERLLVQLWKVKWDDGDEEQMERADLIIALALVRRIRLHGPLITSTSGPIPILKAQSKSMKMWKRETRGRNGNA